MRALRSWLCLALAVIAMAPASPARAAKRVDIAANAAARVEAALQTITATTRPGRGAYATVWDGNKYVQCRREPDRAMRCEAVGTTMQPSLHDILTAPRLKQIGTLGWTLDPSFGNYVRTFPPETSTAAIAAQIVRVLAEGYDADLTDLDQATAWIEDVPCPPRNAPGQDLAGLVNDDPSLRRMRTCRYTAETEAPPKVASAAALVARSGAIVSAEIRRLRLNAKTSAFAIFDTGNGYIQCLPETAAIYCEAQSAQSWPALATVLTPERLARLHAAGYADPRRGPNYWKKYPFDQFSDDAVAGEILTLLYEVYGYAGAPPLDIKTE